MTGKEARIKVPNPDTQWRGRAVRRQSTNLLWSGIPMRKKFQRLSHLSLFCPILRSAVHNQSKCGCNLGQTCQYANLRFRSLVRWQHPQRGFISPAEFKVLFAERTGYISTVTMWMIERAL